MKTFQVNIILNAKELAELQETYFDQELWSYDIWC